MGNKKPPPKKSDEEKEAEKVAKANQSLFKACKDDELKKVEEAVAKGADINWQNDKGHTAVHMCAAYGALNVIRYLHKQGADLEIKNEVHGPRTLNGTLPRILSPLFSCRAEKDDAVDGGEAYWRGGRSATARGAPRRCACARVQCPAWRGGEVDMVVALCC